MCCYMNHVVQPGDKRRTYLLHRKEVKVRWGEPPVETKHCMVIPCVVLRDEDSQIQYDIMIPKNFYNTVLDTQIVAKKCQCACTRSHPAEPMLIFPAFSF